MNDDRADAIDGWAAISLLRAPQWAHFVLLPLAPLAGGAADPGALIVGVVGSAASLAFAYGLNAITDRHTDRDVHKNPLRGVRAIPRGAAAAVGMTALVTMVAALMAGPVARAALLISLLAGSVYSAGPRAKSEPIAGALTNTLIFVPLLYAGVAGDDAAAAFRALGLLTVTLTALVLQNQLVHELADRDEDAAGSDQTTARLLGTRGTRITCVLAGGGGAALALEMGLPLALPAAGVMVVGGLVASAPLPPARLRVTHRRLAFALGAGLFALQGWVAP